TPWPPVRSISTLIPVPFSNSFAMCWAAATGVDVYQVTAPSCLAIAASTGSGLKPWAVAAPTDNETASSAVHIVFICPSRDCLALAFRTYRSAAHQWCEHNVPMASIGDTVG